MPKYIREFSLTKKRWQNGFTFTEVMITVTIIVILFGAVALSLIGEQNRATFRSIVDTLISDIRNQQIKAISGATEGKSSAGNFGIYFLANQYVLFHGNSYNASDPSNLTVNLPSNVEILSTGFTGNMIIFSPISGEIAGFLPSANVVSLKEINQGEQITITFNKYGVITGGY